VIKSSFYIAQLDSSLISQREAVMRELKQHGYQAIPLNHKPDDVFSLEQQMQQDLEHCDCFVQLLDQHENMGIPQRLLNIAEQAQTKILQWRADDLDIDSLNNENHQQLLRHESVRTGSLVEFQQAILEEIFRYRQQNSNEASAFVTLLLQSLQNKDMPAQQGQCYVVITMRSDFLGNAAEFSGLPEIINQSLFLTPRLNHEQLADAICLPAQVYGGKVEAALLNELLNQASNEADQLPLLQHALMRLWANLPAPSATLPLSEEALTSLPDKGEAGREFKLLTLKVVSYYKLSALTEANKQIKKSLDYAEKSYQILAKLDSEGKVYGDDKGNLEMLKERVERLKKLLKNK
jgi:hypothetical protein